MNHCFARPKQKNDEFSSFSFNQVVDAVPFDWKPLAHLRNIRLANDFDMHRHVRTWRYSAGPEHLARIVIVPDVRNDHERMLGYAREYRLDTACFRLAHVAVTLVRHTLEDSTFNEDDSRGVILVQTLTESNEIFDVLIRAGAYVLTAHEGCLTELKDGADDRPVACLQHGYATNLLDSDTHSTFAHERRIDKAVVVAGDEHWHALREFAVFVRNDKLPAQSGGEPKAAVVDLAPAKEPVAHTNMHLVCRDVTTFGGAGKQPELRHTNEDERERENHKPNNAADAVQPDNDNV